MTNVLLYATETYSKVMHFSIMGAVCCTHIFQAPLSISVSLIGYNAYVIQRQIFL